LQQRIEELIHKIQFGVVKHELQTWAVSGAFDLLKGFLIVSRYQYPELDEQKIINQIEAIKRDAWIELRYDTSPVEKVKILNLPLSMLLKPIWMKILQLCLKNSMKLKLYMKHQMKYNIGPC
jgi:hypothetical protein